MAIIILIIITVLGSSPPATICAVETVLKLLLSVLDVPAKEWYKLSFGFRPKERVSFDFRPKYRNYSTVTRKSWELSLSIPEMNRNL